MKEWLCKKWYARLLVAMLEGLIFLGGILLHVALTTGVSLDFGKAVAAVYGIVTVISFLVITSICSLHEFTHNFSPKT